MKQEELFAYATQFGEAKLGEALADSIQADSAVSAAAKLSGTCTDVVHGSNGTNGRDTNFPQVYPAGTTGRGVAYSALSADLQAIEAWANTQASDSAATLLPVATALRRRAG